MGQIESGHDDTDDEESIKRVFDKLDRDRSGSLNLVELLSIKELPGLDCPFTNSPLLLFKFDTGQDGTISREEFARLVRHLKEINRKNKTKEKYKRKKIKRQQQKQEREAPSEGRITATDTPTTAAPIGRSPRPLARSRTKLRKSSESLERQVWRTIDAKSAAELHLDRNTETPMITGRISGSSDHEDESTSEDYSATEQTEDTLLQETQEILKDVLKRSASRKKYMTWLFRLADVNHTECISVKELAFILQALHKDGIKVENLPYEASSSTTGATTTTTATPSTSTTSHPSPTSVGTEGDSGNAGSGFTTSDTAAFGNPSNTPPSTSTLAQRIMEEYDTGKTGFLNKDEFMLLADLIVRNYEATTKKPELVIGPYELKRKLGSGSSGEVRLAVNAETGEKKAVKIVKKGDVSNLSRLDVEIKAMMMLRHPSIVALEEVLEDEDHCYFVMELCGGGSIADYVERRPLSEPLARFYFGQLVDALEYCHSQGVCHRDLKLENLILDNNGNLKITDFGSAGIFKKGWDLFNTTLVGTVYHIAPEQIAGQAYSGEKLDIWATGVVLYRLTVGKPPFWNENYQQMFEDIKAARYDMPSTLSADLQDLIRRLLQLDPAARPSVTELRAHPWLQGTKDKPKLATHEYLLEGFSVTEPDIPWEMLCTLLDKLNVHILKATSENSNAIKMVKCKHPEKDLKFSISLKVKHLSDRKALCMEFQLRQGEVYVFQKMVTKIVLSMEKKKKKHLGST